MCQHRQTFMGRHVEGGGRGRAYTYDWIENLFGLGMHSAN
jgi:hypothetical protein